MMHLQLRVVLIPLLIIFFLFPLLQSYKIPRLSPHKNGRLTSEGVRDEENVVTFYYDQALDHFNYAPQSYDTFPQQYVVDSRYWGGPGSNSPIFAYMGAESPLVPGMYEIGFLTDVALYFHSLSIYIEHRFYGKSIPFGSTIEEALKNETTRGYFNSAQAIADYAEILLYVKDKYSSQQSPIIVVGGSYGGMLAAWFRLKYPHIVLGALASSAPILYFDNITSQDGYYSIVAKDFKEVSQNCFETIRKSWDEIELIASKPGGLSILSHRFKTCRHLKNSRELRDFLKDMYAAAAQYDRPPNYPVTTVCKGIDEASPTNDVIGRIFNGVVSYMEDQTCYPTSPPPVTGWQWQTCSEMVMPMGIGENNTMFPPLPFDLHQFVQYCKKSFGVLPRPHWITTYYGGHDIKLILKRFGSNIIFSNGLRDPYSSAGILEDLSESIVSLTTPNGSHCLDILLTDESDPEWLIKQRNLEVNIIEKWLTTYYVDQGLSWDSADQELPWGDVGGATKRIPDILIIYLYFLCFLYNFKVRYY